MNRPIPGTPFERVAAGAIASFWEYLPTPPETISGAQLGALIRAFHEAAAGRGDTLLEWDAFSRVRDTLARERGGLRLSQADFACLSGWVDSLESRVLASAEGLTWGTIHGDAHTGNILGTADRPVLIDFDQVGRGPLVWDLVPLAVSVRRFDLPEREYDDFVAGYGEDLRSCELWDDLVHLRELYMTCWMLGVRRAGNSIEEQLELRLRYWRGEIGVQSWLAS